MYVNLDVVDYEAGVNDLDIWVYNSNGSSRGDIEYKTGSTEANETINLPKGETLLIWVFSTDGSSNYHLTVGQRLDNEVSTASNTDFAKNEIISYVPFSQPVEIIPVSYTHLTLPTKA